MSSASYSVSELLDLAVDKLPMLRRRVVKARLSSRRYRAALLDELALKLCDNPESSAILGATVINGLMEGGISSQEKFGFDPANLEKLLQIIIEYLPQLLAIILPLFMQLVVLVMVLSVGSIASAQDCYTDPLTGREVCPLKKVASAVGKTVNAVGAAITPNSVPLPVQYGQSYAACNCSPEPVSVPVPVVHQSAVSTGGWSKSWHIVPRQPVRNFGRRVLGR